MAWYEQSTMMIMLGVLLVAIVVFVCFCNLGGSRKGADGATGKSVSESLGESADNTSVTPLEESSLIDVGSGSPVSDLGDSDAEDFGMYEGSLAAWLARHHSNISVANYTQSKRQKLRNVHSVNNPVPRDTNDDYTEYAAPETQNYIRYS